MPDHDEETVDLSGSLLSFFEKVELPHSQRVQRPYDLVVEESLHALAKYWLYRALKVLEIIERMGPNDLQIGESSQKEYQEAVAPDSGGSAPAILVDVGP